MEGGEYINLGGTGTYSVEDGQKALILDEVCRNTGKRESDGSHEYMDRGSIVDLELVDGPLDGMKVKYHESGNTLRCDEDFFA